LKTIESPLALKEDPLISVNYGLIGEVNKQHFQGFSFQRPADPFFKDN
jgi:hypothetical protein